jgi:glyoxylase-like metal-dependent hydrolase (beta-lactamase superfamily II)
VAAYGHTPGHTLFMVESKGEKFAYLADITNVPQLFARNPDWAVQFDMNAEEARVARRKVFDMIASERVMAGGFHFPFPAFGRVEKLGNGFEFKPVA